MRRRRLLCGAALLPLAGCGGGGSGGSDAYYGPYYNHDFVGILDAERLVHARIDPTREGEPKGTLAGAFLKILTVRTGAELSGRYDGTYEEQELDLIAQDAALPLAAWYKGWWFDRRSIDLQPREDGPDFVVQAVRDLFTDGDIEFAPSLKDSVWEGSDPDGAPWRVEFSSDIAGYESSGVFDGNERVDGGDALAVKGSYAMRRILLVLQRPGEAPRKLWGELRPTDADVDDETDPLVPATMRFEGGASLSRR